jgi:prepilin-type N-terminal cleavage/methylation domain-containing protein
MITTKRRQSGVTLIELMISLVLGLIVTGAVLALIASIIKSNGETIKTTRLTQELRAMSDVLAMEVRRARGLSDPLANVGSGGVGPVSDCDIDPVPSGTCVQIGYDCNIAEATGRFRTFSFQNGELMLATATDAPPACGTGAALNSSDLALDNVTMAEAADGSINVTLTGHLRSDNSGVRRSLSRAIWPRSTAVSP